MAFLDQTEEEEQAPQGPADGPQQLTEAPGAQGAAATPGQAPSGSSGPAAGSGFVAIDQLVDQNRGSAQRLADRVAGTITGQGDSARKAIADGLEGFRGDVAAKESRADADILGQIASNPTGLANDPTRLAQITALRDAEYAGPNQLEDSDRFATIRAAIQGAQKTGQLAGSDEGLSTLIGQSRQGSTKAQSRGARTLDTALIQGDDVARKKVSDAAATLGDLDTRATEASDAARKRVEEARTNTTTARESTRKALSDATGAFKSDLDARLTAAREAAAARAAAARSAIGRPADPLPTTGIAGRYDPAATGGAAGGGLVQGQFAGLVPRGIDRAGGDRLVPQFQQYIAGRQGQQIDPQALADLGITAEQFAQLSDLSGVQDIGTRAAAGTNNVNPFAFLDDYQRGIGDLGRYVTEQSPDAAITRGNLASADDYARLDALNRLAGTQDLYLNPAEASLAGTAPTDLIDFNIESALEQKRAALEALAQGGAQQIGTNARSGGNTFAKNFGRSLTEDPLKTLQLGPVAPLKAFLDSV